MVVFQLGCQLDHDALENGNYAIFIYHVNIVKT